MAIYNQTTTVDVISELLAMVNTDSNLTLLFNDATNVIFRHSGLGTPVIRALKTAVGYDLYLASGWTSGTTLVDSYKIMTTITNNMLNGKVIVSAGSIAFGIYASATIFSSIVIGKLTNNDVVAVGGGSGVYTVAMYNITKKQVIDIVWLKDALTINSKYLKIPLYVKQGTALYPDGAGNPSLLPGFEVISRPYTNGAPLEAVGTDLILNGATMGNNCILGAGLFV